MGTTMPEPSITLPVLRRAGWRCLLMLSCLFAVSAVSAAEAEYRLAVAFDLPGGRALDQAE